MNSRGNIGVLLLALIGSVFVWYSGVNGLIIRLMDMNNNVANRSVYRASLNSLLSYTRAAIKSRWCMTARWDQDSPSSCNLAHPRSIERLLLSDSQLSYIDTLIAANPAFPHGNPIPLDSIELTLNIADLDQVHPLFPILNIRELSFVGAVKFSITRPQDVSMPQIGTEAHLLIEVELIPKSGVAVPTGRSKMKAWSLVTAFPREVGTFALMVAGDLFLDGRSPARPGDVALKTQNGGQGLIFDSPVFVNHNVYLPAANLPPSPYLTFADYLVIGRGQLRRGSSAAQPPTVGSMGDMAYSNLPGMGGMLKGIKVDDQVDLGLDVFSGRAPATPPNTSLLQSCVDRNMVKYDLEVTKDAALLAKTISPNSWRLSWSRDDFFRAQSIPVSVDAQNNDFYNTPSVLGSSGGPVIKAELFVGNAGRPSATMYLPADGTVRLQPKTANSTSTNPGEVVVAVQPVIFNGRNQKNQLDLSVNFNNPENIKDPINIKVTGYDVGFMDGRNIRGPATNSGFMPAMNSPHGPLRWTVGPRPAVENSYANAYERADGQSTSAANLKVDPDWQLLEELCFDSTAGGAAFKPSLWDVDFSGGTRFSWNVKPLPPGILAYEFKAPKSSWSPGNPPPDFHMISIAPSCIVRSSANFVAGLMVCDTFTIEARGAPLRIVGTVIAGKLRIDPSAISAGIRWSNIYHPGAVSELRAAGILKSISPPYAPSCDPHLDNPVWHPTMNVAMRDDRYNCNPISLRNQIDPFRWTTMDPDCGLPPGVPTAVTSCKNHPVRFVVKEVDKGFEI